MNRKNLKFNFIKIFIKILIVLFVICIMTLITIIVNGFDDKIKKVDVAVVLGNQVFSNMKPSKRLESRLDEAVRLFNQEYFKKIIVSGGIDKNGNDESIVMKNYLVQHLIKEDLIIMDNQGINTYTTAINTKRIMEKEKFKSVLIISQYYHILRTKMIFKKVGINEVYNSHSKKYFEFRDVYSVPREVAGIWFYFFIK